MSNNNRRAISLYSFPTSPYGMKVACYLAYKNVNYEFIGVSPINFGEVSFTGKRQVPVLQIGDDWKLESTQIGIWLEELFPDERLLGSSAEERETILALDKWVDNQQIPTMFRAVVDWPSTVGGLKNGWKLAHAVNRTSPLPWLIKLMWPLLLRKAKFIVAMVDALDRTQSLQQAQEKIVSDFVELLDGGPFLGGRTNLSLADLSAFPVFVFPYRFGLEGDTSWLENPSILAWLKSVQQHLPDNPLLIDDKQLRRALPS